MIHRLSTERNIIHTIINSASGCTEVIDVNAELTGVLRMCLYDACILPLRYQGSLYI